MRHSNLLSVQLFGILDMYKEKKNWYRKFDIHDSEIRGSSCVRTCPLANATKACLNLYKMKVKYLHRCICGLK